MKLKTFILTFLMMSCSIVFGQGTYSESAKSEAQIMMHLADDEVGTITIVDDISIGNTIEILNGRKVTIDLNGHELSTNEEIYIFKNFGKLTITDSDPEGKGTIIAPLGIYNGKPQTRTISTDINYYAQLNINGGKFVSTSSNVSAAIYNHLGVINIRGGEFYGEYSAITNYGMANIENAYIECLNRDNGAAAIINDFEIEYGENVRIVGRYTTATETGVITPSDYEPTYLFAELNGTKYPSLQEALDACTTGDNTINLLFHNSDDATVSQKEGVNITIDGNGYKNKQFEYTGTIYVNGNSRHEGAETLTIQDIDFYTEKNTHDFISCNDGGNSVIRYAHNVTVQNCNFTATEESTAVVATRFRQSYNINVKDCVFTNLHSAMWATGTTGIAFDNITATNCKEGGISVATSSPVSVKNSTIEGAQYGVRADGSGAYSLTVEKSNLTAEVPVVVRNTTGEYNLTVENDATLTATNNGPQVVVTKGSDNAPYETPTSDVNVTLYDNVTSTFGLTAKIGNAFYATLQDAIDKAKDGDEIVLVSDVTEDVKITQKADLDLVINGDNKTFNGVMTVFGDARHNGEETLTIKNINFVAKNGSDACILSPDRTAQNPARYSYSHNVTVENCSFTDVDGNVNCAAIRHNDGGDVNWTLNKCAVDNTMHSLIQTNNVNGKLVIAECIVNSKNGVNLNSCTNVEMTGCNFDVQGYALRSGVNSGGNLGTEKTFVLKGNTLKSACGDGDAVIMFRASSVDADFSMTQNVVSGTTHISGNTAATKINADENYWDGKDAPVATTPIVVNSYYSDATLSTLVRNKMGSINAFVSSDLITGDVITNAERSIKIEIIGKDDKVIGTSSLEKTECATGFNNQLTWLINLGADNSNLWAMTWNEGNPSINNMPAKVRLYVDGEKVAEAEIIYTANGDGTSPVFAAKTDAEGKINSFIACTGKYNLNDANTFLKEALTAGDNVAITVAGTYAVPTGKDLTITGAVDGVVFDNIGACNMGGANVTFNNVTFDYYPNVNYTGLQHSGDLVYNNCTINGQVFLYGTSEIFNNCTFNQNSSDAYNVWTYGAKEVAFNECTFNSAGKSVLIYTESKTTFNDVDVTKCTFNASASVEGKAAIEMDSSLSGGINLTIDDKTTAEGFDNGNVSGNSLWNNKMGNNNDANNDITVIVAGETVLEPVYVAKIGEEKHRTLQEAINNVKNNETITLLVDCDETVSFTQNREVSFVLDGNKKTYTGSINITARAGKDAPSTLVIKDFNFETDATSHDFINSVETNYYPNNITITGCSFKGTSDINTEGYAVVAVRLKSANNIKIENCTGTGLHSFLQNTAGWKLTIDNVDVNDAAEGAFALGTVQGVTIKECEINSGRYGIRLDAQYDNNAVIESNNIYAFIPVVVRKASVDGKLTFNGTNEFTQTNTDGYWCVIGTSEYKENGELPTAATAKVSVTLTDETLDPAGIYGNFGVASINRDDKVMKYLSLAEALDAALDGETVNLHWTTGDAAISMAGTVCGKTVTITGTANVDWSKGWFYVGRNGAADGKVIFDNANLTSVSNSSAYGINVSGRKKGSTDTYNGTVEFKNSTVVLDYLIQKNVMTLDNSTLTVKNGCSLTGRLANETENGELATSTTTLNNGSKLVVIGQNGMNLGYEGYGVLNIDATSTFEATQNYGVAANGTMNIAGMASVAGTMTNSGAINLTDINATLTATAGLTVNTDVADYKVAYIEGVYKLVEKDYIAQVGDKKFELFTEALDAVENEGTITLLGEAFDESGKEIDFTKAITFTITGQAPEAKLPIITFQNAIVNIKDANFQIPELDARQNATINVINSTIVDAGGNSIVKSYYNGAIYIDANSTVYTMQVTTMGYITVAGTLNATWQTNVYGNGLITLNKGATFNTAALHLTAQDYSGRDNTDTDRVGKPAEIIVDGANLTVGKVLSAGGQDYSYNSSKGINVGTVEGKSAILNIKNGANVNIYMANGETTNFGTGATVNVDASTLNTICRAENGTVTLANKGVVNVTGEANINIKKLTGNAINFTDVTIADAYIGGAVNAFGTNNINGTTTIGGILSVGYNNAAEAPVVVNITGNFNGGNVLIGSSNEHVLNLGDAEGERTTAHFATQLGAFGDVNINNADVTYQYAFIRNDFNVTNSTMKNTYSDTYIAGNAIVVVDASTWNAGPHVRIGNYSEMYGNADVTLKNKSSMTATNLTVGTDNEHTVNVTIEDNSRLEATKLSNQGSIVLADVEAKVTSNEFANAPTTTVAYHKVNYVDGSYVVVAKDFVAQIFDAEGISDPDRRYETLAEAFDAAQDGDEIVVLKDVTYTKATGVPNGVSFTDGLVYTGDKSFTVNFDGHTITDNGEINDYLVYLKNQGEKDNEITFKNGTIATKADRTTTAFAAITVGANSATHKTTLNLNDMKVVNVNPMKADNYTIRIRMGSIVNLNENTVVTSNGTSYGVVAETDGTVNINSGAEVVHTNSGTTGGNLVYTAVSGNGTININDGAKIESDNYAIHNMTTGKTVINIYGGTITAPTAVRVATNGGSDQSAVANILGGTITGNLATYTNAASIVITGGIFSVDPSVYCAENYGAFPYDATSWIVREISGEQTFDLVAGWNWVSSYITEFEGKTGLAMLQEGLGENGIQIKNDDYTSTYRNNGWSGKLTSVSVDEMYKVNMSAGVNFKFEGSFVNYDEQEIVLRPGWNYIGYPVNVETNLADALVILSADGEPIGANAYDVIKSQDFTSLYFGSELGWVGDALTLVPGEGYMYNNTSDEVKLLRYTTKEATTTSDANTRSSKHWTVDATQYPSNMTMIAMTDVEGGNYEVAAFVNGEVRGSSRPIYVEELDAYILILTISGDDVEEMTFKYYDLTTGEEVEFSNRINYSNDAIVGSADEPYMLTRGTTGIGEAAISNVNIYPNPTTTGTEINLQATCDKVEVFNALGVKVVEYHNVDSINALETAGIYVIRITNNGNVQNCRLVVR